MLSSGEIVFESVSKRYRIGGGRSASLLDVAREVVGLGRPSFDGVVGSQEILALDDVNFHVEPGTAIGFIGVNGAGKTTALKLIAGTTEPTAGTVNARGRIAPIIALGAGMHNELTGRENIYINGAILGMTREEAHRKFDSIVAFAELEKFIDTPLKRYSTGMRARLSFSVAAHLEPDILVLDEVLAVGDINFQNKCFEAMDEYRRSGATIVFVSHYPPAVAALCQRAIWLDQGRVMADGDPDEVIAAYYAELDRRARASEEKTEFVEQIGTGEIELERVVLLDGNGHETQEFRPGSDLTVRCYYRTYRKISDAHFQVHIGKGGSWLFSAHMLVDGTRPRPLNGRGWVDCTFQRVPLVPGNYTVSLRIAPSGSSNYVSNRPVARFTVVGRGRDYGMQGAYPELVREIGVIHQPYTWNWSDGYDEMVGGIDSKIQIIQPLNNDD